MKVSGFTQELLGRTSAMRQEQQFIPLTLDNKGRSFYNEFTWVGAFTFIALLLVFTGLFASIYAENRGYDIRGTIPFLVISEAANFWFWTWLIRVLVVKERVLKKMYLQERENRITDIGVLWGVYSISDTDILHVDGRCSMLVAVKQGYTKGRQPDFDQIHFDRLTNFYRHLILGGFKIKYYNRQVSDANIEPLQDTEQLVSRNRNTGIYQIEMQIIKFLRQLTEDVSDTEYTYMMISCDNVDMLEDMRMRIAQALEYLNDSLYTDIKLCKERDIYFFIQEIFGLSYINVQQMIKNIFKKESRQLIKIDEIIYSGLGTDRRKQEVAANKDTRAAALKEEDNEALARFNAMREENANAIEREYTAKVNWVLEKNGYVVKNLSRKRRSKLEMQISGDELREAEETLQKLRKSKKSDIIKTDDNTGKRVVTRATSITSSTNIRVDLSMQNEEVIERLKKERLTLMTKDLEGSQAGSELGQQEVYQETVIKPRPKSYRVDLSDSDNSISRIDKAVGRQTSERLEQSHQSPLPRVETRRSQIDNRNSSDAAALEVIDDDEEI